MTSDLVGLGRGGGACQFRGVGSEVQRCWVEFGEFWAGILVQFLRSILDRFLGDSRTRFACIAAFLHLGWGISDRFRTGFWTFISPTSEHDFSEELTVDPN
jgi:hypothetical protein